MDKEFDIEIREVLSRVERVKAESLDDAINEAMDMYYSEKIVLDSEDMKGVDFLPYSKEQLPSSLKENECSKLMAIKLIDHIIIGDDYYSFYENKTILGEEA